MAKNKKKEVTIKGIIIAVLLVVLVLWYFNHLSNRSSIRRSTSQKTEVEALMEYDMAAEYPKTPRDVAKLHNRYFKAFYGQKLADDEMDAMNKKVRQLYCTDLLVANPESDSLANLQKDRTGLDIPREWEGGLSGGPCTRASEALIAQVRSTYGDRFAIAGIGGVFTPE